LELQDSLKKGVELGRVWLLLLVLVFGGCSVKHTRVGLTDTRTLVMKVPDAQIEYKILRLETAIRSLSAEVDEAEAKAFSRAAILYPRYLAQRYELVSPPNLHNFLITVGLKERGLCYHWAGDLMAYLKKQKFNSFDLYRAVARQGRINEHSSIVVTARGRPFAEGIVLDAWRNSSDLYFEKVTLDKEYRWEPNRKYRVERG